MNANPHEGIWTGAGPWRVWLSGVSLGWILGMCFVILAEHIHIVWT